MGFTPTRPTKSYEDNEAVTNSITSNIIILLLRRIDVPLYYMNNENTKGPFDVIKNPSRIELAKTGAKLESGTSLL